MILADPHMFAVLIKTKGSVGNFFMIYSSLLYVFAEISHAYFDS